MEKKNVYIEQAGEIAKLSYERGVDWSVALSMWEGEHPYVGEDKDEQMREFLLYVKDRRYDAEGNDVTPDGEKK